MLDHLLDRYSPHTDRIVVIAAPTALPKIRRHLATTSHPVECVVQQEPTGMLPAVLCAQSTISKHRPHHVWITWCDQIAISAGTVKRLADEAERHPDAALVFPTVRQEPPYVHYDRDPAGRIVRVLQRREGDEMPSAGESDVGLFALRLDTYLESLLEYDRRTPFHTSSGERNFLPFIPWLAARAVVRTFLVTSGAEAVGVNTPDDLHTLETYLHGRV